MQLQAPGKAPHRGGGGRGRRTPARQLRATEQKPASTLPKNGQPQHTTQPNCSSTGRALLLPHRIYTNVFSESLSKSTPWDSSLKRRKTRSGVIAAVGVRGLTKETLQNPNDMKFSEGKITGQTNITTFASLALMRRKQQLLLTKVII